MGARNPERKKRAETKTWNGTKQDSNWENSNAGKPNWTALMALVENLWLGGKRMMHWMICLVHI